MRLCLRKGCCCLILLVLFFSIRTEGNDNEKIGGSPQQFVEEFYNWYVKNALKGNTNAAWNVALKYRITSFCPELALLLREDSAAQAECEELVGIDFDPFLNSQDPAKKYAIGKIYQKGRHFRADIFGIRSGKRNEKHSVTAEIAARDGGWFFVNFLYPDGTDLLTILKSSRPECSAPRNSRKQ